MKYLEIIVLGLILIGAVFYLHKTFFPKKKGGCGCDTSECKAPKVTIDPHK
ncbi:MAG: FeoB-associated Cys-rich membrane protein [Opitutae bacterium]|nr:FeoB-associated Cys-rich membrane protein [Opitutae bacterium]MDG1301462.1 FeoB-associated Cys-rich membrane protein [Opitutae bacterium]